MCDLLNKSKYKKKMIKIHEDVYRSVKSIAVKKEVLVGEYISRILFNFINELIE